MPFKRTGHSSAPRSKSQLKQTLKYGPLQREGARRREWIQDAGKPGCFVERATLTFDAFRKQYTIDKQTGLSHINTDLSRQAVQLGLPEGDHGYEKVYQYYQIDHRCQLTWGGLVGPGVIVLDDIERPPGSAAPAVSEVSQALYTRHFAIDSLKHVFVTTIVNPETLRFISQRLYSAANGLTWDSRSEGTPLTWGEGTAEYDALLGTRIGKTIAYLVLGAFERGTRRIARIVSWSGYMASAAYLRFDIEAI